MTDNGIRDGAEAICEMLKVNTTLKSLKLSGQEEEKAKIEEERNEEQMIGNWIREEGKKILREAWGTRGGTLEL